MHQLLLLRHAKSSHKDRGLKDYDRPLAGRGRKDCRRMGKWMLENGIVPDLVISSPALRADQTAKRVCKRIGVAEQDIQWEEKVYDANARTVLKLLTEVSEDVGSVMVVGHHEALESIILRMSKWSEIPADPKLIPTAGLAILEFDGPWSTIKKNDSHLKSITRPRDLAAGQKDPE